MVVSVSVTGKVAVVTIDNPPVNATSQAVRQGLFDALAVTETDDSVMAVILACAGKTFVAGADVTEFGNKGVGVRLLAALAGHAHISTTQRYIDVNSDQLSQAVELL